jgi:hypothetical protein
MDASTPAMGNTERVGAQQWEHRKSRGIVHGRIDTSKENREVGNRVGLKTLATRD